MIRPADVLIAFNRSRVWRRRVRIGSDCFRAPTLDRLIYLGRHKFFQNASKELNFLRGCIRPGMHVLDVGANVGVYSHVFAHAVGPSGRVTAFEPDPILFAALEENARVNGLAQLHPQRMALGNKRGAGRLNQGVFNAGDNRVVGSRPPIPNASAVDIALTTLDEFLQGVPVDFIKMDIQGWEMKALRGMTETLRANPKLQLYVELWPFGLQLAGSSSQALLEFLAEYGFTCELHPKNLRAESLDFVALAGRERWFADIHAYRASTLVPPTIQ